MFILKRLLQLQVGRFNFRNNESLNILGSVGKKKEPLFPYDKDMLGVIVATSVLVRGNIYELEFKNGNLIPDHIQISSINVSGTLAPAS